MNRSDSRPRHLRDLPVFLRAPRAAGLWLIGVLIALASVVAFGLSYRGLFLWALHHQWPLGAAPFFPLLVDVPFVVCEVILFVAAIDGDTPGRVRGLAWLVLLAFTGLSVVGNADHAAAADPLTRGGFALPPLVLAIALGFGLGELKRQSAKYRQGAEAVPRAVPVAKVLEIRERRGCGQRAAQIARAEVQLDRRSRDGDVRVTPRTRPRAVPAARSPAGAAAPTALAGAVPSANGAAHGR
jgi:hypothetical protein